MSKLIKQHLDSITVDQLYNWKDECFTAMCSCNTSNGNFALGVNGHGRFAVKDNSVTYLYESAYAAVRSYKSLVSGEFVNDKLQFND